MRLLACLLGGSVILGASQGPIAPPPDNVRHAVRRFFETADHYQRAFRNLTVEETKVNEEFDTSGRVRKRQQVVSDLVVYRSTRTGDETTEYRDVRSVDGKLVDARGTLALDLITRATGAASLEQELRLVNEAGRRYDSGRYVQGFAIRQVGSHAKADDFSFESAGRDRVNGHDTVVLRYQQIAPGDVMDAPTARRYLAMGITSFVVRGRLWLDATTFQLRRWQWQLAGVHLALAQPADLVAADGTFGDSRFDILVPERFVFDWYENGSSPRAKPAFVRVARTTFAYGAFKRFEVATEETLSRP